MFLVRRKIIGASRILNLMRKVFFHLGRNLKAVFFEVYGCQMNRNDTEIAKSILQDAGFEIVPSIEKSDTVLLMTCAIRETAEAKIWKRLQDLKRHSASRKSRLKVGVLGCMAERLKENLIYGVDTSARSNKETDLCTNSLGINVNPTTRIFRFGADFVCGPDSYRDLPKLIGDAHSGLYGSSVALSLEETYADITPVRRCSTGLESSVQPVSAFISVMRGCDNMCTFCIVPFVRGRERSRPLKSIVDEAKQLVDEGVKEVTLLGQNVNSYCDKSDETQFSISSPPNLAPNFRSIYKPKTGGLRFIDLLDQVSRINPELRVRFTSPHPKDFPSEVLQLIGERKNICSQIHLPAQSGSSEVLERMGRGYTSNAYLNLVGTIKRMIPDISLTSDFISGFCGETEKDHLETLNLIKNVGFSFSFCFPYSLREKTRAYHRLVDDVPKLVKLRRCQELLQAARQESLKFNLQLVGRIQLILIEGLSRRSPDDYYGRNDQNIKVIIPCQGSNVRPGDYVAVQITRASSQTLHGNLLGNDTVESFNEDIWKSRLEKMKDPVSLRTM